MSKHHFSFQEVFKFGLAKTQQHAWFIFLTFIIISIILSSVRSVPFFDAVISLMVGLSLASISLMISRNQHFTFQDLYNPLLSQKRVLKFILLTIVYVIAVAVGTVLFVLPGIYLAVRFKFFPFVVLEHENSSLLDLIKMTYKITENNFWSVFLFLVIMTLLNIAGFLLFVIGLLVTIPMSLFAFAHVYNRLKEHSL